LNICYVVEITAQQMHWSRLADDTIYYANEYLPDRLMVTATGPGQIWDFRSLRAPYALSRRVIVTGEHDKQTYASLINGKQSDAILAVAGKTSTIVQVIEDNPLCTGRLNYTLTPAKKPFFNAILGGNYIYRGKMTTVFAWPRDINCNWKPSTLPDSVRITYDIVEEIIVDGEGTLYLPTEVNNAYRQHVAEKRTIRIEAKIAQRWLDMTSRIPGLPLITYTEILRFVESATGLLLADVEIRDGRKPVRIEFKTHPLITRIFPEEPSRPDIFAYPNPSFDIVRFQMSDLLYGKYKLKIFNILGVGVKSLEVEVDDSRETVSVDLSEMQRGTYLFRLEDSLGRTIKTKRVVLIQS
nr:T9SS type A sorting domain-containing protein [Bacteroidota bacterium]